MVLRVLIDQMRVEAAVGEIIAGVLTAYAYITDGLCGIC